MTKCKMCGREIYGEDEKFFFLNEPYHLTEECLLRAIRLSRKKARLERQRREQQHLPRWSFNG